VQGGDMRSLGTAPSDSSEDWIVFVTRLTPSGGATFGDWVNSLDEISTAATYRANPDQDEWSLVEEYAFDLDPFQPDAPHFQTGFNSSGSDDFFQTQFRWNSSVGDLVRSYEVSENLLQWTPLVVDGVNATDQIADSDPDGDDSAELRQVEVKFTGKDRLFLRVLFHNPYAPLN